MYMAYTFNVKVICTRNVHLMYITYTCCSQLCVAIRAFSRANMAIVLARLFLVLALVFVSLLAIVLAWELSWHRSRLCVTRGMS